MTPNPKFQIRHPQSRRQGGFTLLELVVVMALAGLIIALVIPRLGGTLEGLKVRMASRQVAALFRTARVQAISGGKVAVVTVDPRGGQLWMQGQGQGGQVERRLGLPSGVRVALLDERNRPLGDRGGQVRFTPRGGSDGANLALSGWGRQIQIVVDPLTGRVAILEAAR